MIVNINKDNAGKYHNLFSEAYQFLKNMDAEKYPEDRFNNLAEYYGHMADFIAQGSRGYKYIMLPLDEEAFEINLNTRTIAVPASFSTCASVQSDQLAETIMFVADRYFDYMDLATTEIFVQWETPEDKQNNIAAYKGATHIEMIDLESNPGKIKFAWPLNDIVTAVPGVVKFSVRFCRLNDNNMNQLFYSLNTLESSIVVKPALSASMPADENKIEKPFGENLFKHAIINSNYATEGVIPPTMPEFSDPGQDISSTNNIQIVKDAKITHLDENNTVTLYAQAHTSDANSLVEYKWYYKASDSDTYYDCENYPTEASFDENGKLYRADGNVDTMMMDGDKPVFIDDKSTQLIYKSIHLGTVKQEDYRECDMDDLVKNGRKYREVYYYIANIENKDDEDFEPDYQEYELETFTKDVPVYEKYTSFTVPGGNVSITGDYKVAAWGIAKVTGKADLRTPYPRNSSSCTIPVPNEIILTKDLPSDKLLEDNTKLEITVQEDPYSPTLSYKWKGSHATPDLTDAHEISGDSNTLAVSDIGWYQVDVSSTLNRNPKSKSSHLCRVINSVQPPYVTSISPKQLRINPNATLEENVDAKGDVMSYDNEISAQKIRLHIDADVVTTSGYDRGLYTDSIENGKITSFNYIWQMREPDEQKYKTLDRKNPPIGVTFDENKPNEIILDSKLKVNVAVFRCLVANKLNNEWAVFDHSCSGNVDSTFGQFVVNKDGLAQAPYIYSTPETQKFVFNVSKFIE